MKLLIERLEIESIVRSHLEAKGLRVSNVALSTHIEGEYDDKTTVFDGITFELDAKRDTGPVSNSPSYSPGIVNVNLMRHGDGKRVYVSVRTDTGEYVVNAERIAVHVSRDLPDPLDQSSPVTVWQDGK